MTNGKKFKKVAKVLALVTIEVVILYARTQSAKKLKTKSLDPSINQYINRLIEFFDEDQLDYAIDEFLTMIDFGVYPHEAFRIVTLVEN